VVEVFFALVLGFIPWMVAVGVVRDVRVVGAGAAGGSVLLVRGLVTPLSPYSPPSPRGESVPKFRKVGMEGCDIFGGAN